MEKEISDLLKLVDEAATNYMKNRLKVNSPLKPKDAEAFVHLSSARDRLAWALEIVQVQNA